LSGSRELLTGLLTNLYINRTFAYLHTSSLWSLRSLWTLRSTVDRMEIKCCIAQSVIAVKNCSYWTGRKSTTHAAISWRL